MGWSLHQTNVSTFLLNKVIKKVSVYQPQGLRYTRKRPLYADERRQLGKEPPMHNRSVVKNFYNRDIVSKKRGCTLFSVGGMAQIGEWSRLRNRDNYSSLLEKNSLDSSSLTFYLLRADALLDLTDVSGRMAQMIQLLGMCYILCMCVCGRVRYDNCV
jgi:hypothetical protein